MPKTLAHLTLELSRAIEELDRKCRTSIERAEQERDRAFGATAGTRKILERYHRALEKAKQSELRSAQEADAALKRDVQTAEEKRRRKLLDGERRYRDARAKARLKERDGTRKAKETWRAAVKNARSKPLSQQRRLRREADEALGRALETLREEHHLAVERARLERQARLQDDLVDERLAVETARQQAQRRITAAAIDYERALAQEEAKMRSELAGFPDARRAQEEHDREVARLRKACERKKDELFRDFRRARRSRRR